MIALALIAMAAGFPSNSDWEPPSRSPAPAPIRSQPGIRQNPAEIGQMVNRVRTDIRIARGGGNLSRQEARQLRCEVTRIDQLESWYAQDGLTDSEATELRNRAQALESLSYAKTSPLAPK